jgi:type II secretory pathway pseudopilin PulG
MKEASGKRKEVNGRLRTGRPRPGYAAAFTLVELMAVVALIGLMMMVVMPSLQSGRGSSLISAARQFSNDLNLARQTAIARNWRVRVLIATDKTIADSGTSLPDLIEMQYRAYAIMYQQRYSMQWGSTVAPWTGSAPQNQPNLPRGRIEWLYLVDWKFLPKGVIFDPADSDLKSADGKGLSLPRTTIFFDKVATRDLWEGISRDTLPFPYRNTSADPPKGCEMAFVEFKSTGMPSMAGSVRLVNGTVMVGRGDNKNVNVIIPGRQVATSAGSNNDPAAFNSVVLTWDDFMGKIKWIQPGR